MDLRFNKPMAQSVVDLINLTYASFFDYDELLLENMAAIEDAPANEYNTTIVARLVTPEGEDPGPISTLTYRRLELGDFLAGQHLYVEVLPGYTDQVLFDFLVTKGVLTNIDEVTVGRGSFIQSDGSYIVTIAARETNLVWVGKVYLRTVPAGHLALLAPSTILPGFQITDVQT